MKKTILATAITALFAATAAQAATVYEKDGTTVEVYGDIEVYAGNTIDDSTGSLIELDDADIGLDLGYDIGHNLTAIASISYTAEDSNINLDESYVGVSSADFGTLAIGQMVTVYDDAGIGSDYQFGWTSFYQTPDAGAQVVKYSLDKDMFYGAVAWLKSADEGTGDDVNGVDGKIGVRVADLDVTLFFAEGEVNFSDADPTIVDASNINIEARYTLDALELAVAYSMGEKDNVVQGSVEQDSFAVAATYQLDDNIQFAGGVANIDNDANDDAILEYFVNTSYAFNSNVNAYVELGGSDADDTELGYAAGMQVTF